jgi:hypothetical protein
MLNQKQNKQAMTFPFDTCEIPQNNWMQQPYSVLVNLGIISIILYYISKTKTWPQFGILASILLFELSHTFSHFIHIPGRAEFLVTHGLSFIVLVSIFILFYYQTKRYPPDAVMSIIAMLVALDAWVIYQKMAFLFNILTFITIFFLVLGFYYFYLPSDKKKTLFHLVLASLFFLVIEINETFHCQQMLAWFPGFPFHILVELSGILPVYFICRLFYDF